jgi:hypothetical protein
MNTTQIQGMLTKGGAAAVGLLIALSMASTEASAIPSHYEIRNGQLTLDVSIGRLNFDYRVHVQGGAFTFDDETGVVSDLTIGLRTGDIDFDTPIDATGGFQTVGNSGLRLNLVGIDLPANILPGFVGDTADLRIRAREIRVSPVRPLPPVAAVPEPTAALLFGAGLVAVGVRTRRSA